jgi:hypothetical protein
MTDLIERPVGGIEPGVVHRRRWVWPAIAVAALLLGGVVGWAISTSVDDEQQRSLVVIGGTELTERQQAMVDASESLLIAYQTNDVDAILAAFTPQGEKYVVGDGPYRVDDGGLRAFVEGRDFSGMEMVEPMTVHENDVAMVAKVGDTEWLNVLVYTQSGEVLITDHLSFGP